MVRMDHVRREVVGSNPRTRNNVCFLFGQFLLFSNKNGADTQQCNIVTLHADLQQVLIKISLHMLAQQ